MRQKALEKLGETSKRKRDKEGGDGKAKKTRKSSSDTIEYLREKSEQEMKLKEKQLELEKSQQEEEKQKNDAFFNVMLQQQQQQQLMMMLSQQSQVMIKREPLLNRSTAFRVGKSISFKLCPWIYLGPKVIEKALVFGNISKLNFWDENRFSARRPIFCIDE